jgi:hypothetical protein
MTVEAIIEMALQHGSMGIFAAFLIWQSQKTRKEFREDLHHLSEKDDRELSDLRAQYEKREERWQQVVVKYDDKIVGDRQQLQGKIAELAAGLLNLEKKSDHMLIQLESLGAAVQEIKMREIAQGRR